MAIDTLFTRKIFPVINFGVIEIKFTLVLQHKRVNGTVYQRLYLNERPQGIIRHGHADMKADAIIEVEFSCLVDHMGRPD